MKKKFECGHKGFGKYCHRCNPGKKKTPAEQLNRLDKKGYVAIKERNRIHKRLKGDTK